MSRKSRLPLLAHVLLRCWRGQGVTAGIETSGRRTAGEPVSKSQALEQGDVVLLQLSLAQLGADLVQGLDCL